MPVFKAQRDQPDHCSLRRHRRGLRLRVGEVVEVRSESEILSTLDSSGALDAMPFMPEMLQYCGKRFRVYKRADKTCDTINYSGSRRLMNTVHLEGLRCDGQAHGGCQARCLLFWKEAWLKRVNNRRRTRRSEASWRAENVTTGCCTPESLHAATQVEPQPATDADARYRCQATELLRFSSPLPWWDARQYLRDMASGNIAVWDVIRAVLLRLFMKSLKLSAYRLQLNLYNRLQKLYGGTPYPFLAGELKRTPKETLGLKPGELVQVKLQEEILQTVDERKRNRGLSFDPEMVPYCGSRRKVLARVERIIDEKTGKMIPLSADCIILENVVCQSRYSNKRLFCPRSLYPFWREIWLKRVE